MKNLVQEKIQLVNNVAFSTKVLIDTLGIITVDIYIKNGNLFGRVKGETSVEVIGKTNGMRYALIQTEPVYLYGRITSTFSSSKGNSFEKQIYGNMYIENEEQIPQSEFLLMDKEITEAAKELRKAKILYDPYSEEVILKTKKLQDLKKARSDKASELSAEQGLSNLEVKITHYVNKTSFSGTRKSSKKNARKDARKGKDPANSSENGSGSG
jgi:hypothetical protein